MKKLYINRGLPGSGKSHESARLALAWLKQRLSVVICSADYFFVCDCCQTYNFDASKLGYAHKWCQLKCAEAMEAGTDMVIIDNTNLTARECKTYVMLAEQNGYAVFFLEPTTPWAFDLDELEKRNIHGVPRAALERMLARWVPGMTVEKALGTEST